MARRQVAQGATAAMLGKYSDRSRRAADERMAVSAVPGAPNVLRVARVEGGDVHVSHVLVGLHRGVTFYDDDLERTSVYTPANTALKFRLAQGAALFEGMPGIIPIACTCTDFLARGTSSASRTAGIRSVNRSGLRGNAAIMGAVQGCKHMLAAEAHLTGGMGAVEYFTVGGSTASAQPLP